MAPRRIFYAADGKARLVVVLQHRDEELETHCYKHISYNDPALRAKWKTALRPPGPAPEVIAAGESSEIALSLFSTQTSDLNGFSDVTMWDSPFTGNDASQIVKISRTYLEGLAYSHVAIADPHQRRIWCGFLQHGDGWARRAAVRRAAPRRRGGGGPRPGRGARCVARR